MIVAVLRARRLHTRALRRWKSGHHRDARYCAWRALSCLDMSGGSTTAIVMDRVAIIRTIARFAAELADHGGAERALTSAIELLSPVPQASDRDTCLVETLILHGDNARRAGRYRVAEHSLGEALRIAEQAQLDPLCRAGAYNALGILAKDTAGYQRAARYYAQAVELLLTAVAPDAPEMANLHHNLAGLAHAQRRCHLCEQSARRAIGIRSKAVPLNGSQLAGDLSVLGAALIGQGRHGDAEPFIKQALNYWITTYGPQHFEVAVNLHSLAVIQRSQHQPAAECSLAAAAQIKRTVLGAAHPESGALTAELDAWTRTPGPSEAPARSSGPGQRIGDGETPSARRDLVQAINR